MKKKNVIYVEYKISFQNDFKHYIFLTIFNTIKHIFGFWNLVIVYWFYSCDFLQSKLIKKNSENIWDFQIFGI